MLNRQNATVFSQQRNDISIYRNVFHKCYRYIIDKYEALGNIEGGFLFLGIGILILNICDFVCLAMIKDDKEEDRVGSRQPLKAVAKNTFGNKNFRSIIFQSILRSVATHFIIGFIRDFKTNDLMMSLLLVQ